MQKHIRITNVFPIRERERLICRRTKRFNSDESALNLYMGHSNGKPKEESAFNSRDVRGADVESLASRPRPK